MSLAAMHWARQSLKTLPDDVKSPARLALMLLSDYADEAHVCWPSIGVMALEMGCSTRSVQRAIDVLEARGLLSVEKRLAANGRQQSNRYHLAVGLGCQSVTPTTSTPDSARGEGDNLTPSEGDNLTGEGDTTVRGRVTPVSPLESTTLNQTPSPSDAGESNQSIFERAAQQTDDGTPPPAATERQFPMIYGWQPDPEQLAMACYRRGLPTDTQPDAGALADFTAHFAEKPTDCRASQGWHERLAKWLAENRQRQPLTQPATGIAAQGDRHANRTGHAGQRQPHAQLSAGEARRRAQQQRQGQAAGAPAGPVYDGDYAPGH